jgi:hypothetical protein
MSKGYKDSIEKDSMKIKEHYKKWISMILLSKLNLKL